MRINEIGRNPQEPGDNRETDDVYEPVAGLIPVPQNPQYAYTRSKAEQLSLVQADHNFEFYHIKNGGARYIGYLQVRDYRHAGLNLRNPVQVSNIYLTPQFRKWGVGMMMYGVVLGRGHTIFADATQTPAARRLWVRLLQQPNVSVRGVMQVSKDTIEEMNDEDYTPYDSEERQLQRLLKRSDTQFITNRNRSWDRYDNWEMLSFAVRPRADGTELEAPGISIYKKHDWHDEWDPVGLYATMSQQP